MAVEFKKWGSLVYIKQPSIEQLDYVAELWNDEETMKDVGGVISFPIEKRDVWYRKMVQPSDRKNFYCLIFTMDDIPVGEVSFHRYDAEERKADFNIKVQAKYRGKGYAKEAMKLMLSYYFYDIGGQTIYDEVINRNGQEVLKKFGFKAIEKNSQSILFKLTKEKFFELMDEQGIKYDKSCGAVVTKVNDDTVQFLLIKNKSNYWGFPKGHIENAESETDTALRECYEETGLNIELYKDFRIETEYFISTNIFKKVVYFIGKSNSLEVKLQEEELDSYEWVSYKDAFELLTFQSDKNILSKANEYMKLKAIIE
ncbi:hydrolase, NUDIX family [Clostridiales bacterium oral taxon 876 str. F0540]|nr:hydrolase, NUDIX family [Clostridiales bacterium oral taxon 876 str. F0540]